MKKIILKILISVYLRSCKVLFFLKNKIKKYSDDEIWMSVDDVNECGVHITAGEHLFIDLMKPRNVDFLSHSDIYEYKHVLECKGVKVFYLKNGIKK